MHSMGKIVNELHAMLKLHEQTLPLKEVAPALQAIRVGRIQKNQKKKSHKATKGNQGKGKAKMGYAPVQAPPFAPKPKKDNLAKDAGKSTRTRHPTDRLCLHVDAEEHELGDLDEPANYKAALLDPKSDIWLNAMNVEMQSMKDNKVWELVVLPPNGKIIGDAHWTAVDNILKYLHNTKYMFLVYEGKIALDGDDDVPDVLSLDSRVISYVFKLKCFIGSYNEGKIALDGDDDVLDILSLDSRFWVWWFNTAYPSIGYGVLKVYGGYCVSMFAVSR
uniref:Zinc finger, CCHC-type n=1 Tax=Tanacetum cinerariifolium TaxID=118510 RepID=A0A6L2J4Z6_TANCI|nr:zinc finger, CCHC-type [Tanacetum cinerariifolium]